ncbi:MAG: hypothetical protein HW421_997 [Ignavibacteria bacterium]|nr:hypothetical protein [Ignavibacteria bacterium]
MAEVSPTFALEAEEFLLSGSFDEAIELCNAGIEEYPDYPLAFGILARAYIESGDIESAEATLEMALINFPQNKSLLSIKNSLDIGSPSLQEQHLTPIKDTIIEFAEDIIGKHPDEFDEKFADLLEDDFSLEDIDSISVDSHKQDEVEFDDKIADFLDDDFSLEDVDALKIEKQTTDKDFDIDVLSEVDAEFDLQEVTTDSQTFVEDDINLDIEDDLAPDLVDSFAETAESDEDILDLDAYADDDLAPDLVVSFAETAESDEDILDLDAYADDELAPDLVDSLTETAESDEDILDLDAFAEDYLAPDLVDSFAETAESDEDILDLDVYADDELAPDIIDSTDDNIDDEEIDLTNFEVQISDYEYEEFLKEDTIINTDSDIGTSLLQDGLLDIQEESIEDIYNDLDVIQQIPDTIADIEDFDDSEILQRLFDSGINLVSSQRAALSLLHDAYKLAGDNENVSLADKMLDEYFSLLQTEDMVDFIDVDIESDVSELLEIQNEIFETVTEEQIDFEIANQLADIPEPSAAEVLSEIEIDNIPQEPSKRADFLHKIEFKSTRKSGYEILKAKNLSLIPGLEFTPLRHASHNVKAIDHFHPIINMPDFPEELNKYKIAEIESFNIREKPKSVHENHIKLDFTLPVPNDKFSDMARTIEKIKIPAQSDDIELTTYDNTEDAEVFSETMAKIYESQGAYSEAIATYFKLIDIHPENQESYFDAISRLEEKI